MSHRLTVLLSFMRQHIENQQPPSTFQCSCRFGKNTLRLRKMMQDQHHQGDVQLTVLDWKFLQGPLSEFHVILSGETFLRRLEHFFGSIHRDDSIAELTDRVGYDPRSASEIAHHKTRI